MVINLITRFVLVSRVIAQQCGDFKMQSATCCHNMTKCAMEINYKA